MWVPPLPAEQLAARRILDDLLPDAPPTGLRRIASSVGQEQGTPITLALELGEGALALACEAGDPPEVLAWRFAAQLQEYLLDRGRQPVPACPVHRHSLVPVIDLVGAWWVCPGGREHCAQPIGALREALR